MRRLVTAVALWLCATPLASGQDSASTPLIGVLRIDTHDDEPVTLLRRALATVGRVEGRNLRLDVRVDDGRLQHFPALADALVKNRASVIVTFGDSATRAAQHASSTIPIVALADDLVASGLISSLARPGGNITGVSIFATQLDPKKLELLKELLPAARRFALLRDPGTAVRERMQAIADTARGLGVDLLTVDSRSSADLGPAFSRMRADNAEAVNVLASPLFYALHRELGALSLAYRLPAICNFREMAVAGCLASYGFRRSDLYAMLAEIADEVLKGASPADTPAQQPTKFELVINIKTAKALGLTIPPALLARADEVIE
jgi:putative tryptophan/tyrosine transport system substrate-binding protein